MKGKTEGARKLWERYKYAGLVVLIGAGMLLWPSGKDDTDLSAAVPQETITVRDMEQEIAEMLSVMSGVGQVKVMLTEENGGEQQLAQDTELSYRGNTAAPEDYSRRSEIVLVDSGNGDAAIVTRNVHPTYRGALVVCQGGDRSEVKLAVTEAVTVLTGLPSDRVTVAKWQ